jgi:hypothetical protein
MAALSTQNIADAGTKPTFGAAALTDTAEVGNGRNVFVVYKNTDTNVKTVTITVGGNTSYGQPTPDPAITVAANTGEVWIPMRKEYDDGTGRATLTVSGTGGVTGVTVAVVRLNWA